MNIEDKQFLFDNLFRHIEKNIDFDMIAQDSERLHKAYDEFMIEVFGAKYYDRKAIKGTYAEKEDRK